MAVRTSLMSKGGFPFERFFCERWSATAKIAPRLSDGWPHSAASHVSLKSSQRIVQPISHAALIGSSLSLVPGTRAPYGTIVPSTSGPSSFVHSGKLSANSPQPSVSIKQLRAVSYASDDCMSNSQT